MIMAMNTVEADPPSFCLKTPSGAAKVAAIPESKGGQIRRWLFSGAGVLTPDKQGRVLIPQDLRSFAGLEKDVVVIGANIKRKSGKNLVGRR